MPDVEFGVSDLGGQRLHFDNPSSHSANNTQYRGGYGHSDRDRVQSPAPRKTKDPRVGKNRNELVETPRAQSKLTYIRGMLGSKALLLPLQSE